MSYTPRDNSGVLFKNDRREKETHPHAKGDCIIDGVEYWVSAWTKEGKKGRFQSLSFERKKDAPTRAPAPAPRAAPAQRGSGGFDDMPDDIPF